MTLHLVVHRPDAAPGTEADTVARTALRDAVWEVADSHWAPGGPEGDTVLVSTDLSPEYLLSHFRRAMARRGFAEPGYLMIVQVGERSGWTGVTPETESWIQGSL